MEEKDLYQKHLETLCGAKEIEDFSEEETEKAFDVLLRVLPNEGKLYKYRSFEEGKFNNYYNALKDGYLWFPSAQELNDDLDTILYYDPLVEINRAEEHFLKNIKQYLEYFLKANSALVKGIRDLDIEIVAKVAQCYDREQREINKKQATRILVSFGMPLKDVNNYIAQNEQFVKCFLTNNETLFSQETRKIAEINKVTRERCFIYSMSEAYATNPMWAFYANNSNGFCIEYDFNKAKQFDAQKKKLLLSTFRVIYDDNSQDFTFIDLLDYIYSGSKDMALYAKIRSSIFKSLATKQIDWSFEREWRIMLSDLKDNKVYLDIVSRIIIDERVLETEDSKKLIALCKERGWGVLVRKTQYINVAHKFEELTE